VYSKNNLRHKLNPVDSSLGFLGAILAIYGAATAFQLILMLIYLSEVIADSNYLTSVLSFPWVIVVSSIINQGALLGFCFLLCKIRHIDLFKATAVNQKVSLSIILILPILSLFLIMSNTPLLTAVDNFFELIKYKVPDINIDPLLNSPLGIIGIIFATCVLPAICEELVFRGIILQGLASRFRPINAILLSAFAFSMMHMSPAQTVHQFILGIALGYVVLTTKSLWAGVLLHFLNNLWAVLGTIFQKYGFGAVLFDNTIFIYSTAILFSLIGIIGFFLAVDLAAKKTKDSIFIKAITGFKNREQNNRYVINYDVIFTPFQRVFDEVKKEYVEQPLSGQEYIMYAQDKEKKHKKIFVALMCIAFGICIAFWIYSLFLGIKGYV
jgi:hypothetical protein